MAIGGDRFTGVTNNLETLLKIHGISAPVKRHESSLVKAAPKNIFGTPQGYMPLQFSATVLVTDQYLDDEPTEAGSKPKDHAMFLCYADTLIEHDEITYAGHMYRIMHVDNAPMAGQNRLEIAEGIREVKPS